MESPRVWMIPKWRPGARGKSCACSWRCCRPHSAGRAGPSIFSVDKNFRERAAERESIGLAKNDEGGLPSVVLGPDLAEKILAPMALESEEALRDGKSAWTAYAQSPGYLSPWCLPCRRPRPSRKMSLGFSTAPIPSSRKSMWCSAPIYDHLKTNAKGQIYPGADDDGSGTTAVLAIAHAMSLTA